MAVDSKFELTSGFTSRLHSCRPCIELTTACLLGGFYYSNHTLPTHRLSLPGPVHICGLNGISKRIATEYLADPMWEMRVWQFEVLCTTSHSMQTAYSYLPKPLEWISPTETLTLTAHSRPLALISGLHGLAVIVF